MERTAKHFRKRDAILSCLRATTEHPSAEWIYDHVRQEIPDISLATVYRNLAYFRERGEILSLGDVRGVERFDGNTAPHVHFICTGCGRIMDLPGITVPEGVCTAAARQIGGRVESCHLTLDGLCGQCAGADGSPEHPNIGEEQT